MAEEKLFTYRGKTTEELKALSLEDFAALLPSSARRKIKRGFTEQEAKLMAKIEAKEKNIKTHCRDMIVMPNMVGLKLGIYNGKEFVAVTILDDLVGMRLGELALTRKVVTHSGGGAKKTSVRK